MKRSYISRRIFTGDSIGLFLPLFFFGLQVLDKPVHHAAGQVLHDNDVRQVAAQAGVIIRGQAVFLHDALAGPEEIDGVGIVVLPGRITDFIQLFLKVLRRVKNPARLISELLT